jgi:UDP-glucose 4-epimerase
MRILITGGAGFIGSHLAEAHLAAGDEVVALDDVSTGRLDNIAHLTADPRFELVVGSILDADLVDKFAERCEVIYHLAAAVGVRLIVEKPLECLETNIKGTEVVVGMAARYRRKILVASTSEIYGKNVNGPLKEDDDRILGSPLKSRWSYSTAKALDEILAYTYWKEKQLPAVIVRLFNTVGPRQTGAYGMVIPTFVMQALKDEEITVFGDGTQSRCFCHVLDIVEGLMRLMVEPKAEGQVYNLGGQEEVTMTQLAERVVALTGSSSVIRYIPYDEAYEAGFEDMQRRVPDTTKARDMVGFAPGRPLDRIIADVIEDKRARLELP